MSTKKCLILAALCLGAAAALTAEVALDELVQVGRFSFYRDHADPHKYYYVPDEPRLATKRDGTPEFTFIKYTKTDSTTKGGIIHFLATWGYTGGELSTAESALQARDPEAKIAGPVPFKEATFRVVSATAGEGGLFNRRIVGEGKAPIMPNQKAAVSIALNEEGASLLWETFKNPTSEISVQYIMKFTGVTPAFQAKLKVDWDKVYTQHDIKLHAEGTIKVVKLEADVRAILEELRQKGAVQLDVVGENENMQKMLDAVYTHLISMMCDKVPTGTTAPAGPPAKKRPAPAPRPDLTGPHPAWSMAVLSDVVRGAEGRVRGGPLVDQEQVQTEAQTQLPPISGCDELSRQKFADLFGQAKSLMARRTYEEAASKFKESYGVCPVPMSLFQAAVCYELLQVFPAAADLYRKFLPVSEGVDFYDNVRPGVRDRLKQLDDADTWLDAGVTYDAQGQYEAAAMAYKRYYEEIGSLRALLTAASLFRNEGMRTEKMELYEKSIECYQELLRVVRAGEAPSGLITEAEIRTAESNMEGMRTRLAAEGRGDVQPPAQQQRSAEEERRARRQQAQQGGQAGGPAGQSGAQAAGGQQASSAGAQTGGTKPPQTSEPGAKPSASQAPAGNIAGGQIQQGLPAGQGGKPPSGGTPSAKAAGQTPGAKPGTKPETKPAAKPSAKAPEIKPIVSVQIGYSFKRVKMSGKYEVDMRKRLREDREMPMSGNIGGIYQRYGEDPRFFTVVSLDDPTFQERSVEVILDGQDASDFRNYINSVSVLFRKQRFSGGPMTGEVKFFEQQFGQTGNRLSFKYGRLNEASTEWLDYEYKPKWSFYGGVEWEGDWTKTSDSVLTLAPPVQRRTLEISVDEDNILKNSVKALAIQIKHQIFGKDILKEIVIDYDKGDPLQANYTYMHEEGSLGYTYKIVWLFTDGREVHTEWMTKESPFIYAVYAKR